MSDLFLWRLKIHPARLAAIAREQNIAPADEDHGYTCHALLCGLFGKERVPKPWFFERQKMVLWAYVNHALSPDLSALADPLFHAAINWDASASKLMPTFSTGQRLGFDLRACPIVRHGGRNGGNNDKATEQDYVLWRKRRDGLSADTMHYPSLYEEWLRERGWKNDGIADIATDERDGKQHWHCGVIGWDKPMQSGANAWRGHRPGRVRLPDVQFQGELIVRDPTRFPAFLAHGIGRHRAFGYGMLLLKPATKQSSN